MTESELLERWLERKALVEDCQRRLKAEQSALDEIETELAHVFQAAEKWKDGHAVKIPGVTATCREKWRATYLPEKWQDILAWAAETGNTAVVQRRLGDRAVMALIDEGVALPEGLGAEAYKELEFRRG